jgi:hypothetical protein
MPYALSFEGIFLLPPLVQLGLHGLQGEPGVLLGRRRSLRGGRRRWCGRRRSDLLWRRRAGDLALQHGEVALSLPDVEVDGIGDGVRRSRVLVLGRLPLRGGWARLLLGMRWPGLASDEGPDPSESLDVLR